MSLDYELDVLESISAEPEDRKALRESIRLLHEELVRLKKWGTRILVPEYCFRRECIEHGTGVREDWGEYAHRFLSYIHTWIGPPGYTIDELADTLNHEFVHHWLSLYEGQVASGYFDKVSYKVDLCPWRPPSDAAGEEAIKRPLASFQVSSILRHANPVSSRIEGVLGRSAFVSGSSRGRLKVPLGLEYTGAASGQAKAARVLGFPLNNLIDGVSVVEIPFGPSDAGFVSPRKPDDSAADNAVN